MIRGMAKGLNDTRMGTRILEISLLGCLKAREYTIGRMVKFMMVSGLKVSNTGMAFGKVLKMNRTSENGKKAKHMGMAFTHGKMGIDTRECGNEV